MAEIHSIDIAYQWNIAKLADAFGLHRDTITSRIRASGLQPIRCEGRSLYYEMKDAAAAIFTSAASGNQNADEMTPHERRAWYQSENERVKLERELEQLAWVVDVKRKWAEKLSVLTNGMDSLPDVLERECGLSPEQIEIVIDHVDRVREQLHSDVL